MKNDGHGHPQDDTATGPGRQGPSSGSARLSHCQDGSAIVGRRKIAPCSPRHPSSLPGARDSTLPTSRPVRNRWTWSSWPGPWLSRCAGRNLRRAGACAAWRASPAWSPTTSRAWATRIAWIFPRHRPSRTWWPTSRPWWRRQTCAIPSSSAPTTAGRWPRSTRAATRCASWCCAMHGLASNAVTTFPSECPVQSSTAWPSATAANGAAARSRTSTPQSGSAAREARSSWPRPATTRSPTCST